MLNEYFVQFGVIIFPITVYQIWTLGKSFNQLPLKTWILGIYGGVSAILCQLMPVHIFGQSENFQCVPVILSILYGKRWSGILAITILALYQVFTQQNPLALIWSIVAILVYSALPMIMCTRFGTYERRKRLFTALLLSVVTLVVELLFLVVFFLQMYGKSGLVKLFSYFGFLGMACLIQLVIMGIAFFLLEDIIENGRVRKRLHSLVRYNPLGIIFFDMNHRFVEVNSAYAKITGYEESELVGKSRLDLWFEEQHEYAETVLNDVLHGQIKQDLEVTLRHKTGHPIPVRFTLVPMMEEESLAGYFGMVRDITESKAAEEFVRNSEKLSVIGQLAAGVAHEIRNPLTSIKGFLQLLSGSSSPSETKYYDIMKSEIARIEGIVSEMLVLAKPQGVSFQPVNIKEGLEEVVYLLTGEANMKDVEVESDFNGEIPILLGDGNQLKQVFLNLGKNAIEAMPDGGKLQIHLAKDIDSVKVDFEDNGQGIPEEMLEKIGQPFFTTKENGTGLGFLISKRIIDQHGGTMKIASISGKGTTVTITLPIQSEHAVAAKQIASAYSNL